MARTDNNPPPVEGVTGSDPVIVRTDAVAAAPFNAPAEEVRTSHDFTGEPRSAEIVPTTVPLDLLGRPILPGATRVVPVLETPTRATTRVLASGEEIPAHIRREDQGGERYFTATARILRSRKIYELDAPVPLTLREFEEKARSSAVRERYFDDGAEIPV